LFITAIAVCTAASNGRRNNVFVSGPDDVVQRLGGRPPAEGLSRPGIEGLRHRCEVVGVMRCQIRAWCCPRFAGQVG
jgi:hypothetical protein